MVLFGIDDYFNLNIFSSVLIESRSFGKNLTFVVGSTVAVCIYFWSSFIQSFMMIQTMIPGPKES